MGQPATLLESLCAYAVSNGADSLEVEYEDGHEWVYARKENSGVSIANYPSDSREAKELRKNLYAPVKSRSAPC